MIEKLQLEGVPLWITEETLYLGKDGQPYDTEEEALATFGYTRNDGTPDWLEASTLADAARLLILDRFVTYQPEFVDVTALGDRTSTVMLTKFTEVAA